MASRRFTAVLFTDVQGYSRMMGEDETGTLDRLKRHNALALPIIESKGGRLIKTIGDSLMCEFPEPAQAVRAGLEIVEALERDEGEAGAAKTRIRVGIHAGDVVDEGTDLFGETVNIAARLEPLAEPGGLAISHVVLRTSGGVAMRVTDCGERRLKNIAEPVRVYRVAPASAARAPPKLPRPLPITGLASAVGLVLIATVAARAWIASRSPLPPHRLAVVATIDAGGVVDARTAWALASRLVEEIDHFEEFRPISPAGLGAARLEVLGGLNVVPDEAQARAMARWLRSDTVAALAVTTAQDGNLAISVHVFDAADPTIGVTAPRDQISRSDLDGMGPARLAERLLAALSRQWRAPLSDESPGVTRPAVPFDAFELYVEGVQSCNSGRYDACESQIARALTRAPNQPLFHALLACSYSFEGKDLEAGQAASKAVALIGKLTSRRDRATILHDQLFVQAEAARRRGDRVELQKLGQRSVATSLELAHVYSEPIGFIYAAIDYQYLLNDIPNARRLYAEARKLMPSMYPAYFEDVKLITADGTRSEQKAEAAQLLWRFIRCNPESPLLPYAHADVLKWRLEAPSAATDCSSSAG